MRARPGAGPWASGWTCGMRTTPRRRSGPLPAKSIEGTSTTTSGTAAAPNLPGGGPGDRGVRALLYVEFATGLRREELLGLKCRAWSEARCAPGPAAVLPDQRGDGGGTAENKKYLPCPASGREYGKRSGSTEEENGEQPLRVPLPGGRAHLLDCVGKMLHRALRRAGLPRVQFHDLRHAFATLPSRVGWS